jgi:hypothetical protein
MNVLVTLPFSLTASCTTATPTPPVQPELSRLHSTLWSASGFTQLPTLILSHTLTHPLSLHSPTLALTEDPWKAAASSLSCRLY